MGDLREAKQQHQFQTTLLPAGPWVNKQTDIEPQRLEAGPALAPDRASQVVMARPTSVIEMLAPETGGIEVVGMPHPCHGRIVQSVAPLQPVAAELAIL